MNEDGETEAQKYLWLRICSGALVVVLALAAVYFCLIEVLNNYQVTSGAAGAAAAGGEAGDNASVSASSAVAVLTPVMAAIVILRACSVRPPWK